MTVWPHQPSDGFDRPPVNQTVNRNFSPHEKCEIMTKLYLLSKIEMSNPSKEGDPTINSYMWLFANLAMHICIYMGVGGLREEGLNIMEQGHWLGTAGQIQARLVKEYKWRDTRTVRYKYSDKREYILQTQCKENRGKIWVSRAYWVISTNDLQIFFFEGATISFQLLRIALYFKDPIWKDLTWRVIVSHNWQVSYFQIVIAIVVSLSLLASKASEGGFLFIHT